MLFLINGTERTKKNWKLNIKMFYKQLKIDEKKWQIIMHWWPLRAQTVISTNFIYILYIL